MTPAERASRTKALKTAANEAQKDLIRAVDELQRRAYRVRKDGGKIVALALYNTQIAIVNARRAQWIDALDALMNDDGADGDAKSGGG